MGLVKQLWNGDIPLWRTFWIFNILGIACINIISFAPFLAHEHLGKSVGIFFLALQAFSVAYSMFIMGATWRSAGNYTGPKVFFYLARIYVFVVLMNICVLLSGAVMALPKIFGPAN